MRPAATFALATIVLALAVFSHGALAFTQPDPTSYHRNGSLAFMDAESGIDLMHVDGRDREPLLENGETSPAWSPDGTKLAYQDNAGVHVIEVISGDAIFNIAEAQDPSWTPDGNALLVSFFGDVVREPLSGDQTVNLTNTSQVTEIDPVESPDGQYLAFSSNQDPSGDPNNPTAGQYYNLWIADANGDNPHLLYESDPGEYGGHPKWAPDSVRLAFINGGDVWTTPPDANNQTNVTNDAAVQDFPAWAPDGTLIAYSQFEAAPLQDNIAPSEIWTIGVDSGMRVNLTNDAQAHDTMPDWQPWFVQNGAIATISQNLLWAMNPNGSHRFHLFGAITTPGTPSLKDVQWSPTGTLVALVTGDGFVFVVDPLGGPSLSSQFNVNDAVSVSWFPRDQGIAFGGANQDPSHSSDQEIYSQTKGSLSDPIDLTNTPDVFEYAPAVSPDGSTIAFISDQAPFSDPPTPGSGISIWTMDFDGLNRQFVTSLQTPSLFLQLEGHPLSWSPDGNQLAYSNGSDVWTIDADGNNARNLTNDQLLQFDVSWSPDGKLIAFDQGTLQSNSQIWTVDAVSGHREIVSTTSDNSEFAPSWQAIWAPGSDSYFPWGDNSCAGKPQPSSLLATLQKIAGTDVKHVPGCPWIGEGGLTTTNVSTVWGDTDCSGALDAGDILAGLKYELEIGPYSQSAGPVGSSLECPPIGAYTQWIPTD